jgi:hypothetical protein
MELTLPWVISVSFSMLITISVIACLMKSHTDSLKIIQEQSEKSRLDQKELLDKLVTLLGTKDPLAYQAVALTGLESQAFESVSMSDEAEAARYQQMMIDQGLDGYGTEPY